MAGHSHWSKIKRAKGANDDKRGKIWSKGIKKGTGELGAENFESVMYEAYAPGGIAMIIEGLTNNPSRTAPDLRSILEKNGGNLATRGAVAFQFTKQGII